MRAEVYKRKKPEEMGVSSTAIESAIDQIRNQHQLTLHSFLMLRGGMLLWEEYFRANEAEKLHSLYSVSKSFLSTAIGLAQAEGALHVDDKLYDFFPEYQSLCDHEWKRDIRLKHLLMMGSGFENNEQKIFNDRDEDLVHNALKQPVLHAPGEVFNYYTLGSYLISAAFQKVKPEGIHAYLKRKLFAPMQIEKSRWQKCPNGVPFGGFGLSLSGYDMTKLGQLYLQQGNWEGQQLLPATWISEASAKQIANDTPSNPNPDWRMGYGYQFWRNAMGGYRADGMYGQYIIILPEKDAVIVMTSHVNDMQTPLTVLRETLLPAVE